MEECDGFFFGNGKTAVEAVIIIVFLKTMLSCFVSMSFIINLIKKVRAKHPAPAPARHRPFPAPGVVRTRLTRASALPPARRRWRAPPS